MDGNQNVSGFIKIELTLKKSYSIERSSQAHYVFNRRPESCVHFWTISR